MTLTTEHYQEQIEALSARLPELEWKLSSLKAPLYSKLFPKGLFHFQQEISAQQCIKEIRTDVLRLQMQDSAAGAGYLAKQVEQKINVLVSICYLDMTKTAAEQVSQYFMDQICTRRQWLENIEQDMCKLKVQYQAIIKSLSALEASGDAQAILMMKAELGEIERQLTIAQEAWEKATG